VLQYYVEKILERSSLMLFIYCPRLGPVAL